MELFQLLAETVEREDDESKLNEITNLLLRGTHSLAINPGRSELRETIIK